MFQGYAFLLCAVMCWSSLPVLTKLAYSCGFTPLSLALFRFAGAFVLLLPASVLWLRLYPAQLRAFRSRPGLLARVVLQAGAFATAAYSSFYALEVLQASLATILIYLSPTFTSLLAVILFKEKMTRGRLFSLILTLAGLTAVLGWQSGGLSSPAGIALAVLSALLSSAYFLLGQKNTAHVHPLLLTTTMAGVSTLMSLVTWNAWGGEARSLTPAMMAVGGAIAVLPTTLGPILDLLGIRRLGASRGAILTTLEPPIALVLAAILLNDVLRPLQILGAVLVMAGVFVLGAEDYSTRQGRHRPTQNHWERTAEGGTSC